MEGEKMLQWHPAFYAGMQIELEQERDQLEFLNEVQLGTKPKEIDVLIVNKNTEKPLKKNIARIFRERNIIEYKGPTDYLSIDDFYTGYAYACFYKASMPSVNKVKFEELTLTFASARYPRKLIKHLREIRSYKVKLVEPGIYYVIGDAMPIQFIVTSRLDPEENLWLRSLTDHLPGEAQAEQLIRKYKDKKDDILYQSVMDVIVRANKEQFWEVNGMCEALMELMADELNASEARGETRGKAIGETIGEGKVNRLNELLLSENRIDELKKSTLDTSYQQELMKVYGIAG